MTAPSIDSSSRTQTVPTITRATTGTVKRSRKPPHPASILDRQALQTALDDAGLTIRATHIDTFYWALHRQHYPELQQFVANYYSNEATGTRLSQEQQESLASAPVSVSSASPASPALVDAEMHAPLKNSISLKKNRNRMQLPRVFLDFLRDTPSLVTVTSTVAYAKTSADGSTTKLAIELHDGQLVESVLMRYNYNLRNNTATASASDTNNNQNKNKKSPRASLCVSSQCGCAMGCTFCATGTMGLSGSLTTGEILEQIVHADRILAREWRERNVLNVLPEQVQAQKRDKNGSSINTTVAVGKENNTGSLDDGSLDLVRNVVFMGMGEPLDNYKNVVEACRALIDRRRWNLKHGHVTVSTVGIISKIRKLTRELPEVNLAVSLHAPNQAMRSAIVPSAKHYPIEDLIDALDAHMMAYLNKQKSQLQLKENNNNQVYTEAERIKESTRRRAMIEYVMLEGDTSTLQCAHELGKLCENRHLMVNLIPYNQTDVKDKLHCPSDEHMMEFRNIVASYGAFCTIRRTMGADIDSACGQLITLKDKKRVESESSTAVVVGDIEDVASGTVIQQKAVAARVVVGSSKSINGTTRDNVDDSASSNDKVDLEQWIRPLATATAVVASCFLLSSVLFLRQKRR
jgi:adenine C2-methylase RlmN of 23S rRNA A2503 and tRNA A37